MPTTFEHTRIASAILTAVAMLSTPAFAADEAPDTTLSVTLGTKDDAANKIIGNTFSSAVTWNKTWAENFGNKNASTLKLNAGTDAQSLLVAKGGTLTNNIATVEASGVTLKVEGGTFVNSGTLKLDAKSGLELSNPAAFDNSKGKIESSGIIKINDSGLSEEAQAQSPLDIAMGDVKLSGDGALLANWDKGYTLKTDKNNTKRKARVSYGKVELSDGAQFSQAKDAMDSGESMSIGKRSMMDVAGVSTWESISMDASDAQIRLFNEALLTTDEFAIESVAGDQDSASYVKDSADVKGKTAFKVENSFAVKHFAGVDAVFTMDGKSDAPVEISSRADLLFGTQADFAQKDDGKLEAKDYTLGRVAFENYNAVWTPADDEDKEDEKTESTRAKTGSWANTAFGDVTVGNNAQLTFTNNRFDPDSVKDQYKASLELDKLAFQSSALKLAYKLDTEVVVSDIEAVMKEQNLTAPEGLKDWTSANLADNMKKWVATLDEDVKTKFVDAIKAKTQAHADAFDVADVAKNNAMHTVSASDIYVRNIRFEEVKSELSADFAKINGNGGKAGEDDEAPEKGQIDMTKTYGDLGSHTLKIVDGSRVEAGALTMANGTLMVDGADTKLIARSVGELDGTFTAKAGYVGLNVRKSMADYVLDEKTQAMQDHLLLEVNGPVKLGDKAVVTFGGDTVKGNTEGASLAFAGESTLKFDASSLSANALFTAEGKKGKLTAADAKVNVEASNLSWGRYYLFENFDTEGVTKENFVTADGKLVAADKWSEQLKAPSMGIELEVDEKGNVSVVVGSDSVEGSGLHVNAKNLVSAIFKGDRASGEDLAFINTLLHNGSSLAEVSNTINAVTGLGVISGIKALATDFAGYTADQIEHHASTMPHDMGGWWIQPIGTRMKTDDLALGDTAYGYSLDAYGLMGGYDLRMGDWTLGLAGSYQEGDADSEGDVLPASTDIKSKAAHLWAAKTYGETYVIGTLSYVKTEGETRMGVMDKSLDADIEATGWSAGIRAERAFPVGGFTFTPHVGARVSLVDVDDYSINMDDKALFSVNEDKATIFEVPVGLAVKTPTFMFQTFKVQPYADVTVRGRFGDTESSYTLEGSKTTDTIDYDVAGKFVGDLKVGYMSTYKDLNLGMSYSLSAGDAGRQNHTLELTMRVDF